VAVWQSTQKRNLEKYRRDGNYFASKQSKGAIMTGNAFLRTSVIFLCIGILLGVFRGATEDFTQARPHLSRKVISIHYWLAAAGLLFFIPGIWGAQIIFFAVMVFLGTVKKPALTAS
jgi:hypothetical protein